MISRAAELAKTPGPQSHSRVHLVYFVLAVFDILAVMAGLLLSSYLASVFERTVEYRQGWDNTFKQMWELNSLVLETTAPIVKVFESGDPVSNSRQFEHNLRSLEAMVEQLQTDIIRTGQAEAAQDALAALHVVRNTLKTAAEHGRNVFSNYYNGWISEAAHCMSLAEQSTTRLKHQIQGAMASVLMITRNYENENIRIVRDIRKYESLMALVILMMVGAVTTYGLHIGRLIKQNHRETADAYERLEKSRSATEAYAARLRAVNEDVMRLNQQLESNMKQLQEAQEEIIRKGKLAQLGQLTAIVAHEIRNPLNAIRTAAYLAERKLEGKVPEINVQMARINSGIARCDNIITELLDFTKARTLDVQTVAVDEWLKDLLDEQLQKLPACVRVEFRAGLTSLKARFDPSRMRRVVINFLTNASEAMVGKGDDPSKFTTPFPKIVLSTSMGVGGIEIACADNGPGITPENLKKIREPLFTTKSFGIGLGLPAVDKILDEHGGKLQIDTMPGEGTKMTAWIPMGIAEQEAA